MINKLKEVNKIKAIIFDVGGVLVIPKNPVYVKNRNNKNLGVHEEIARNIGISIDQWFDSIDTTYSLSIEGKIFEKKALEIISKNTKTPKKKLKQIIINAYKRNFIQNKSLFNLAFKLKKKGYKIGVLSDQWYFSKEALMPKKKYSIFNPLLVSCNTGFRKPSLEIYKLLITKLKLNPSEILFIDNQEWNINPARRLKIKTILFKDNKQLFKQLLKMGVVV